VYGRVAAGALNSSTPGVPAWRNPAVPLDQAGGKHGHDPVCPAVLRLSAWSRREAGTIPTRHGPMMSSMASGDAARLYHRLSSVTYLPEDRWPNPYLPPPIDHPLVLQNFVPYAPERLPPDTKAYPSSLPTIALPRDWTVPPLVATEVLGGMSTAATRVALEGLGRLLHLSAGVVRFRHRKPPFTGVWRFRPAASAGGRFPLEIYVAAHGVHGLEDGVYWYDPMAHALVRIAPPPLGDDLATTVIVTGVAWRTTWRYAERGFRHVYWDAGSMLGQLLALADSAGWEARLYTRFPDARLAALVGADGVQEFPIALVTLGDGNPALHPGGEPAQGSIGDHPTEFPLVTLVQQAGNGNVLNDPWPPAPAAARSLPPSDDLDTVALRRGSTRHLDPEATTPRPTFETIVGLGVRGTRIPHFIAVHNVEGLERGLYRWPDLDRPIRAGDLRQELLLVCWDQNLGRDATFVSIAGIDLAGIDDRGYREAQLAAGIASGRLHLTAYALGHGASGMTFLDDECEALLGSELSGLLITCVGIPTYTARAGGMPGRPVEIGRMLPGETPREPPRSSTE
jgi:SagB-type dehydrogenase family enzyme